MLHRRDGRGVEGAMGLLRRRSWGEGRAAAQSGQRWGQEAGAGPAAGQSHKSHKDAQLRGGTCVAPAGGELERDRTRLRMPSAAESSRRTAAT